MGGPTQFNGATAQRLTWSKGEVCFALGVSEGTFDKKRDELAKAGFPPKLPGLNAWSIAAVMDWVAHPPGYVHFAERLTQSDSAVADVSAQLEHEYAGAPQ